MSRRLLVDTDVLIDFLRGREEAVSFVTVHSERILVSSIVVAELYAGARDGVEQRVLAVRSCRAGTRRRRWR